LLRTHKSLLMEGKFLDSIFNSFENNLPTNLESLEQYVKFILPKVKPWSGTLQNDTLYLGKRWKELRDTDTYHETVLHIFMPGGEYLVVIDGDISKGAWRFISENKTFIVDYGGRSQLFDLAFLNNDFFILQKHGDQERKGKQKYFVYAAEDLLEKKKLDWRSAMELLYNVYRESSDFSRWVGILIMIIVVLVVYSLT
jgi:hypothetical protein